jgi:hypothetical protein
MKKVLPFAIAALMIPSVALAKGPNSNEAPHGNHGKAKVQYVLKGDLSGYSAFDSSTSTNGSITIAVKHANRHGRALKDMSLTFTGEVASTTKVVLRDGVTVIADGDRGIVKVRAPKEPKDMSGTDLAAILTALSVRQIVDKGPASSS